ncbi:MAG: cell division protein FtsA [Ignavibacteriales bacterium]
MKRNIVVGLDLGTTKIAVAVGEVNPDGAISVLGLSKVDSAGLKKGSIVDIESAVRAIDEAMEEVERISGIHITSSRTGFGGISVGTVNNRATIAVGHPGHEITSEDVGRVIQAARLVTVPPDRSVIHIIPRQYTVDGYEGIIDPVGMVGTRLEVEVVIVTAATAALQNIVKTITKANTRVKEIALSSILAAESVLQPAEKEMGVALIDIGGGTCDIAVFEQGSLVFASVLPIGGDYITRDLAVGLRTTVEEARKLKEKVGFAVMAGVPDDRMVEVPSIYGKDSRQVSEKVISSIIQPRVEEILELIDLELRRTGFRGGLPGGAVFTGGTALLKGIIQAGEEYLNMPVRLGYPENLGLVPNESYTPENAAVLGNLVYGAKNLYDAGGMDQDLGINAMFSRVVQWFKDLFS